MRDETAQNQDAHVNDRSASQPATHRVVVLLAAYKANGTVREAAESILDNTLAVDLLVIDDCSPEPVADVLGDLLAAHPERMRLVRMAKNSSQAACFNFALHEVLGRGYDYVAVMDADDVALPGRFVAQVAFLDAHPDVGAVGTAMQTFDEVTLEPIYVHRHPSDDEAIRRAMFFNSAMVQPSAMIRAEVFRLMGGYNPAIQAALDYEFWRRIQTRWKLANLPEVLLRYRLSSGGQTMAGRRKQLSARLRVQLLYFVPGEWRAWAGVLLTLGLFVVPLRALIAAKSLMWKS